MLIVNIIFYAIIFRICGGGIVQTPRWIPLLVGGLFLAVQLYSVIDFIALGYIFVIVRLLPTKPLLDAANGDKSGVINGFVRNLLIIPALFFANWWFALFLLQSCLYWMVGYIWRRKPIFPYITYCELISGAVFGSLI